MAISHFAGSQSKPLVCLGFKLNFRGAGIVTPSPRSTHGIIGAFVHLHLRRRSRARL
ncbi:hypothetical protein E1A91_A08G242000v1 [Gossypium mustelinum]|uniref:Uncharacterized protein n=1 Tax=Gossypium mustelinum TaxID=34275 RepID=A0A5D2YCW3_GOSMU|nr:hypothetical protein E1A91_A08G242000v1 [Gossypium mustelinum]